MSRASSSSSGSPLVRVEPEAGVPAPGVPALVAVLDGLGLPEQVLALFAALDERRRGDPDREAVLWALDFARAVPQGGEYDEADLWDGPDPWADAQESVLLSADELDARYGPVDSATPSGGPRVTLWDDPDSRGAPVAVSAAHAAVSRVEGLDPAARGGDRAAGAAVADAYAALLGLPAPVGWPRFSASESAVGELAVALRVNPRAMPGQVERAVRLSGLLPGTWALLAAGRIGPGHARAVVDGTQAFGDDPELLARVECGCCPGP